MKMELTYLCRFIYVLLKVVVAVYGLQVDEHEVALYRSNLTTTTYGPQS